MPSIARSYLSRLAYDALRLRQPRTFTFLNAVRAAESLSSEGVKAAQYQRLEELLRHAARTVPYYARIMAQAGYDPSKTFDPERFRRIPLLDKATITANNADLQSNEPGEGRYANTSGGSTGQPVRLIQDRDYHHEAVAVTYYFYELMGVHYQDPAVILWGSERDILERSIGTKAKIVNYTTARLFLNAFRMTEEQMVEYVEQINAFRPVYILAYVQSVFELARFIKRKGLSVHSPKAIMTSAGTLYDGMRQTIEEVFGCRVSNRYGSREVGDMASECSEHNGLHISSLSHYIEVLDELGNPVRPGEMGEVVVTLLLNRSMPLIRYRIGDMAVSAAAPCACGRGYPLLEKVVGRTVDVFVTPRGDLIDGEYFTHLFYFKEYLRRFQVIQDAVDSVRVLIEPSGMGAELAFEADIPQLERDMRVVLGPDVRVEFRVVPELLPSPSGKFRFTISNVRS